MGNKKNKNNKRNSTHRHIYSKKRNSIKRSKLDRNVQLPEVEQAAETSRVSIEGSRIININKLQEYLDDLHKHSSECGGSIILSGESRDGIASILASNCSSCQQTITLETSKKVKGPRGYRR